MYRASFLTINRALQNMPDCPGAYQVLRESLLNWIFGLAQYRPKPLKWNMDLLVSFGDPSSDDEGACTVKITTAVFNGSWGNHKRFPARAFYAYCLDTLGKTSFNVQMLLFSCLSSFLDHVALRSDRRIFAGFAVFYMPAFDEMMTEAESLTEDMKRTVFHLIDSFIRYKIYWLRISKGCLGARADERGLLDPIRNPAQPNDEAVRPSDSQNDRREDGEDSPCDSQSKKRESVTIDGSPDMESFPEGSSDDSEFDLDYIRFDDPWTARL
jgi:hypothetical protein